MARPTTVKTLPRIVGVTGGARRRKGELKENTGAKTRKTKVKTLPQATIVPGGGETRGENEHKMERWHNPQSREGGWCLAENAYQKRTQNNVHHKGKKTKHTVLCYCVSSQLTLAAPRLGAEEGVGKTTKKNEHEKPTVPCLCLAARLPRPWPRTEWEGRRDGRKANRRAKGTTPGPTPSEGSVGQEKYKTHKPSGPVQSRKRHFRPCH